jgi:hypothetical protein
LSATKVPNQPHTAALENLTRDLQKKPKSISGNFLVYFSIRGGYRNGYPFLPVALEKWEFTKWANTEVFNYQAGAEEGTRYRRMRIKDLDRAANKILAGSPKKSPWWANVMEGITC